MKTRMIWITLAGVALALAVAIVVAPAALAQGPGGGYGAGAGTGPGGGAGYGRGMGGPQSSLVAVAAQQLNMPQVDLVAELQSGKTIAQVAADKHVALDTIVNAFVATRAARLDAAVAAGRLTRTQANTQLATMQANITARLSAPWSPQGNGLGAGFADQDGDGVCDNAGSGQMGSGRMGGGRMGR
ncbi:MAG: hypothetical protein IPO81_27665 [Kouleothrix sp.]|nr:hypothetical protein [Kouleothrix sp.]